MQKKKKGKWWNERNIKDINKVNKKLKMEEKKKKIEK